MGDSPKDKTKVEVLLSSVLNNYVEQRLDLIESIGLNVVAFEPDALALTRAMVANGATEAQLIIDMGQIATDLVITIGDSPRLARSLSQKAGFGKARGGTAKV